MKRNDRIPMKGGDEEDAFTSWRRVFGWRPGTIKAIKRKYNKRVRRTIRRELWKWLTRSE